MAPAYKLTYFALPGVAEPIRYLFSYGGIDFEDIRTTPTREGWGALKPTTPFGQLPMLEKDGKIATQSIAIARYVAKQVDLVGKDDWEDLEIDAVVDTINDMRAKFAVHRRENNPELKESLKEAFYKETLPEYLAKFDAIAKKNNGYIAVGKLTWADIFLIAFFDCLEGDFLAPYPNLVKIRTKVLAIPEIAKWVATRPKSLM